MKTLIAFALCAICSASAFAELKIGTVDMMVLVRNHASYETNKKLLQDAEREYQEKLDGMKAELDSIQDEGKKLADQGKNPMLSQASKDKIEKDLIAIQNRYISAQQKLRSEAMNSQQKLQEFESRLLKIATDDIRNRVNEFADSNGYDLIVESSAAAFAKKDLNVTDAILTAMGVDPATAKGRAEKGKDEGK
jgi:Skp family chaperone for outer membrane proteins